MAENETEPQESPQEKKGRGKLIVIAAVVLLAIGGAAVFFLFPGSDPEPAAGTTVPTEGAVVDGATMTVALSGEETHFARVSFALVLVEGADSATIGKRIQILQDAALTVISGYDAALLKTSSGLDALRSDLTARAHEVYPDGEVLRVVLTEVIVQ